LRSLDSIHVGKNIVPSGQRFAQLGCGREAHQGEEMELELIRVKRTAREGVAIEAGGGRYLTKAGKKVKN